MKDENVKKRGWVKNAAIVFLTIMLVLTFFSNTILNLSLPEVAAQYTTSGTISARIRGTGTVVANETFEVISNQTRTVRAINVRVGDIVETGEVLFTLAVGSDELEAAREKLRGMLLEYEKTIIRESLRGDYASEERGIQLERHRLDETQEELDELVINGQLDIDEAENVVAYAFAELASAEGRLTSAEGRLTSAEVRLTSAEAGLTYAEDRLKAAEAVRDSAQEVVDIRSTAVSNALENLNAQGAGGDVAALQRDLAEATEARRTAEINNNAADIVHGSAYKMLERWTAEQVARLELGDSWDDTLSGDDLIQFLDKFWTASLTSLQRTTYLAAYVQMLDKDHPSVVAYDTLNKLSNDLSAAIDKENQILQTLNAAQGSSIERDRLTRILDDARAAFAAAERVLREANVARTAAVDARDAAADARNTAANARDTAADARNTAIAERDIAKAELAGAESGLKAVQDNHAAELKAGNAAIKARQQELENMLFALSEQMKRDGVENAIYALDMSETRREISLLREEIERLEEGGTGTTITAPVSGIIKQIMNTSSGNTTMQPGDTIATIEIADRGYSLNFPPITLEQSRRVTIGDVAEINTSWWWAGDVRAVLVAIRNDPQNPATGRILVFDVSGDDVESGMELNLTLGERSANYEVLVPNSALRLDGNGDFVLVVVARSSPLGNRYTATRVDVNILASDDTNTAVSGGLSSWDFVITTSTRPIQPGMQVRLVDNP